MLQDKESALHVAAYHGHEVVVEMLAAKMKKEDINAKNEVSLASSPGLFPPFNIEKVGIGLGTRLR